MSAGIEPQRMMGSGWDGIGGWWGEENSYLDFCTYLIFVTGATGGARVNFFGRCKFLQI